MQPTLVILAAGMASRYGSMKQIQGFGPGGETIMDYSIYDAIRSGFGKVVFIIRREFADEYNTGVFLTPDTLIVSNEFTNRPATKPILLLIE